MSAPRKSVDGEGRICHPPMPIVGSRLAGDAAAAKRDIAAEPTSSIGDEVQFKYVEMPRGVIDEEAVLNHVGPVAIVDLGSHEISQTRLPTSQFGEWGE